MIFASSIKHPNEFSILTGRTQLVKEIESINQSIRLLLTTAKGELFGDPYFGCNLYSYLYDYSGEILVQLIKDDIVRTLTEQDTRIVISNDDINVTEDQRSLHITISYQIRYTNYRSDTDVIIQKRKEEEY